MSENPNFGRRRTQTFCMSAPTKVNPMKLRPVKETDLIANIMELVDRGNI
jgi:hypothetical protein